MKRNTIRKIIKMTGSLLCASAVVLSGIPCSGPAPQAQAVEEAAEYIEKEIGASSNISFDAPEEIPINTLCEGEVGGENPTGDGGTWTDYFDRYQVEIPQEDFTATKRGRFHLEFSTVADSAQAFDIEVSPKDEYADDYYSETVSGKTVTPDYSYYGPVEIRITPKNTSIHHKYRFKIVYEILENDGTGQWAETELNTSESNAAPLELNRDYWGCLQGSLGSNKLWYQYTLDRPGKVSVSIKPQDGKKQIRQDLWWMSVHDKEDYVKEYLSGQNASGVISDTVTLDPGTYRIEVYTFSESAVGQIFQLRVNYEELYPGNKAAKAAGGTGRGITNTKVAQVTLKASPKKKVTLKWKKNKAAQGYQIYRSTERGKGFKCVKVIKNRNTTKWKDMKVKKGRIYYYKLRAYSKIGKTTYYSKYTKAVKIKVK